LGAASMSTNAHSQIREAEMASKEKSRRKGSRGHQSAEQSVMAPRRRPRKIVGDWWNRRPQRERGRERFWKGGPWTPPKPEWPIPGLLPGHYKLAAAVLFDVVPADAGARQILERLRMLCDYTLYALTPPKRVPRRKGGARRRRR
jgi:hypothetical protein